MILRGRQNFIDHAHPPAEDRRARIERLWLNRPITVLVLSAALCLGSLILARRVTFDYNLLKLQTRGLPAVVFEQKLIHSAEKSVLYCVVVTDSLADALALESRLTNLTTVASVDSMALFLTEAQGRKLGLIGQIKVELAPLRFAEIDPDPVKVEELSATLYMLQGLLGLAAGEIPPEDTKNEALRTQLVSLRRVMGDLRQTMLALPREVAGAKLAAYQQALFEDVRHTFAALRNQDNSERMRIEDLPVTLRDRFVSKSGALHLVQVYPKYDVWERGNQEAFVRQIREALDPQHTGKPIITGTPVQQLEYTTLLKDSYQEAAWYSLAAIALLILIHFQSLTCVVLALIPVGVGMLWMVGFMGLAHIDFNPANIMTLPLAIGIGVNSGIQILNRFAEERNPGILAKSTGKAVLVSALTTIAGFGSLALGKHQGIASLGFVLAVGTATCMVAALTILPALLNLLLKSRWRLPSQKEKK